jgi:3-oxoacyl-[acyl-carrier protein] reductase
LDLGLHDRTVLVTGAHRGTGAVIAAHFAREGARVLLHGPNEPTARAATEAVPGSVPVWGDLTTEAGVEAVAAQVRDAGGCQVLVNNHGRALRGSWDACDRDAWLEALDHNLLAAARLTQALLPDLKAQGWGRIVNVGTLGSSRPGAAMPHYYAAKGALATLTQSLARAVAGTGITVNLVSPGLILTDEVREHWLARGRREGIGDTWAAVEAHLAAHEFANPLGRIARREEVADAVLFLASDRAAFVHGQNLRVDGGALGTVT